METKQIAFIVCTNNAQYYEECMKYIGELNVPEGYSVDPICIQDAESLAQAYNAGMKASNAKYKVYLHQDTFILNQNFLYDIIDIFEKDETIGMIGMLGSLNLTLDCNGSVEWNVGRREAYNGRQFVEEEYLQLAEECITVKAINGFLMATQYDVDWNEDIFNGWDFCDIAHSLEMQKQGYKVVVPYQKQAWCYHDKGILQIGMNEKTVEQFRMVYPECFSEKIDKFFDFESLVSLNVVKNKLIRFIETNKYELLDELVQKIREIWPLDLEVREIINMMEIYGMEKESAEGGHSIWFTYNNWTEMYEVYLWVRLILLRIGYGRDDERMFELKEFLDNKVISKDAIRKLSAATMKDTKCLYKYLEKDNMMEPLVSVIMLVYNGEGFIRKTIDSVLNQTYKNIEFIIVDDASTDGSREIISDYQDPRLKPVFMDKNRHVCYTGNVAFQMSKGKYVALIGHDDIWKEDKLEKQISFMEEHPGYSVCFTWADIIDENMCIVNEKYMGLYRLFCGDNFGREYCARSLFFNGNRFCAPSACIRNELLSKNGGYRYALVQLQDYDLWMRLIVEGSFYILQEKLVLYRRFNQEGKNLSSINDETIIRGRHEEQWIQENFVSGLSTNDFLRIFENEMQKKELTYEKQILCEKAFLLWNSGNCFAEKWFVELLEDEDCRNIFEEIYDFTLTDFYKMNTKSLIFDKMVQQNEIKTTNQDEQIEKMALSLVDSVKRSFLNEKTIKMFSYEYLMALRIYAQKMNNGKELFSQIKSYIENLNIERLRKQEKIVVGFIANGSATWIGEQLYHLFEKSERFEPYVFLLANYNGQSEKMINEEYIQNQSFFEERGVKVVGTLNLDNGEPYTWDDIKVKPEICIWLNPWQGLFRREFQLINYSLDVLHTYIPYGFMVAENENNNFIECEYNQLFHNVMWKIFDQSQFAVEKAKKYAFTEGKNAVFTGYPKMDAFYESHEGEENVWNHVLMKLGNPKAKKIIFAPHHSVEADGIIGFSTFASNYMTMLNFAKKYCEETVWIFKPHPFLKSKAIQYGIFKNEDEWDIYVDQWRQLKNGDVMEEGAYCGMFLESDAMIMDSVSFLVEYLYANKPLLFLRGHKQAFNEFGKQVIDIHYNALGTDEEAIEQFIKEIVLLEKDDRMESRKRFLDENLNYVKKLGHNASTNIYNVFEDSFC